MGYNLNPPSNLRISTQNRTFCVGVAETMVGTTIGLFVFGTDGVPIFKRK